MSSYLSRQYGGLDVDLSSIPAAIYFFLFFVVAAIGLTIYEKSSSTKRGYTGFIRVLLMMLALLSLFFLAV